MVISQWRLASLYLNACLLGVALGLFYDGLRILRMIFGERFSKREGRFQAVTLPLITMGPRRKGNRRFQNILIFFLDLLFCLIAAVSVILLFYQMNNGKIRFLAFPTLGVGFYLYRITLGRLVMAGADALIFLLEAAVRYVFFFVTYPFKWAIRRLTTVIKVVWKRWMEKRRRRARARYTEQCEKQLEVQIEETLRGVRAKKGARQNVGAPESEKTVQFELDGQDLSGGHRGGVHRRVRQ